MKTNKRKFIKLLKTLIEYPSVTGHDCTIIKDNIVDFICNFFKEFNIKSEMYNRNGLFFHIPGKATKNDPKPIFSAHYDIIGAMVSKIEESGKIRLVNVGGYPLLALVGNKCRIYNRKGKCFTGRILPEKWSTHIFSNHDIEKQNFKEDTLVIRLDEKVSSKKDLEKLEIEIGNFVFLEPEFYTTKSGYICSRYLDDKAGIAILMTVIENLAAENFKNNIPFSLFFSAHEETGYGASLSFDEKYDEFIAVDIGISGPGQESAEDHVTICVKDSCFPYDEKLIAKMINCSKKNKIKYKLDIFRSYGSDAGALIRSGQDVKIGLIGPGIDSSHSFERTHYDGIVQTINLIENYVKRTK